MGSSGSMTFAAYADWLVELASLDERADLYQDSLSRLSSSVISEQSVADPAAVQHQLKFTLAAVADWSRAMNGIAMDECVQILHFDRALPIGYSNLRITARQAGFVTLRAHATAITALASMDQSCRRLGRPLFSSRAVEACDFVQRLCRIMHGPDALGPPSQLLPTAPLEPLPEPLAASSPSPVAPCVCGA